MLYSYSINLWGICEDVLFRSRISKFKIQKVGGAGKWWSVFLVEKTGVPCH
jgi:hypothetical protein